jgi:FkbM family methyltransferase
MAHIRHPPNYGLSDIISRYFPTGYVGYCVDVGASDGQTCNTTYGLELVRGWKVLSVEPNPEFHEWLCLHRGPVEKCACSDFTGKVVMTINVQGPEAYSTIGEVSPKGLAMYSEWREVEVEVRTVEELLAKHQFPRLDVLCVDTEGTELNVLKGVDLAEWKPKVIVTECWDVSGPIDGYLSDLGYIKISRIQPEAVNDLFYLP